MVAANIELLITINDMIGSHEANTHQRPHQNENEPGKSMERWLVFVVIVTSEGRQMLASVIHQGQRNDVLYSSPSIGARHPDQKFQIVCDECDADGWGDRRQGKHDAVH